MSDTTDIGPGDVASVPVKTLPVTCGQCGAKDEIMAPAPEAATHENKWLCSCGHLNTIEGEPGHPGEGVLNPAAAGLTDEELAEAYERRIAGASEPIAHSLETGGGMASRGEVSA